MNGYPSCMNRNRNSMMRTNAAPSGCSSIPSRQGMAPSSMPHQDASCIQSPAGQPETRSETSMLPSSRGALLTYINEISFAAYDALLYLDTHPYDREAMEYFDTCNDRRNIAIADYQHRFGPLNLTMPGSDGLNQQSWQWCLQPWPWEGGSC